MTQPGHSDDQESSALSQQVRDEQLRNLGLMLSGFAHELNTPLGVIASLCDGLQRCHGKLAEVLAKPQLDAADLAEPCASIVAHMQSGDPS